MSLFLFYFIKDKIMNLQQAKNGIEMNKYNRPCRKASIFCIGGEISFQKRFIEKLCLRRPIYEKTAAYGHFGRTPEIDGGFSWEKTDLIDLLTKYI